MPGPNTQCRRANALAKHLERTRNRAHNLDSMSLLTLAAEVKGASRRSAQTKKRHDTNRDGLKIKQRTSYSKGPYFLRCFHKASLSDSVCAPSGFETPRRAHLGPACVLDKYSPFAFGGSAQFLILLDRIVPKLGASVLGGANQH